MTAATPVTIDVSFAPADDNALRIFARGIVLGVVLVASFLLGRVMIVHLLTPLLT